MAGLGECRWRRDVLRERIRALEGRRRGAAGHHIQLIDWMRRMVGWVRTDLVEYMIMGYNREDVRSRYNVCAVGWWCGSLVLSIHIQQYGAHT